MGITLERTNGQINFEWDSGGVGPFRILFENAKRPKESGPPLESNTSSVVFDKARNDVTYFVTVDYLSGLGTVVERYPVPSWKAERQVVVGRVHSSIPRFVSRCADAITSRASWQTAAGLLIIAYSIYWVLKNYG